MEYARRKGDNSPKILGWLPYLITLLGIVGTAYVMSYRLDKTENLAERTAVEVSTVKIQIAIQGQSVQNILETQREMQSDMRQVLREVRKN